MHFKLENLARFVLVQAISTVGTGGLLRPTLPSATDRSPSLTLFLEAVKCNNPAQTLLYLLWPHQLLLCLLLNQLRRYQVPSL